MTISRDSSIRPSVTDSALLLAAVLLAGVVGAACDSAPTTPASDPTIARPWPEPEVVRPQERSSSRSRLKVDNQAVPPARSRVATAVADLKAAGIWKRLTRTLAVVQILTRTGRARVPSDGHLADAYWTALFEPGGVGGLCSIAVYTSAMRADLARARSFYERGLTGPPVGRRAFWASILAHELAHCLPGQPGERVARSWEGKVLRRMARL